MKLGCGVRNRADASAAYGKFGAEPIVPVTIFGRLDGAIKSGANAQRRQKGDTHQLNALRTLADRLFAPGAPIRSNSPNTNAHCQTRLFRDEARTRSSVPSALGHGKKQRWDTAFRRRRDLASEPLYHLPLTGKAGLAPDMTKLSVDPIL
jgi:hypothetical protein